MATAYDKLPADFLLPTGGPNPAHSATVRTVYSIGQDKKVRLTMPYPLSVGRNFAKILRARDAVQKNRRRTLGEPSELDSGARRGCGTGT